MAEIQNPTGYGDAYAIARLLHTIPSPRPTASANPRAGRAVRRCAAAAGTTSSPHASANACTVPITADSSLNARPVVRGNIAMTNAAAVQNAKNPMLALAPTYTAPAAPGNPTSDSV